MSNRLESSIFDQLTKSSKKTTKKGKITARMKNSKSVFLAFSDDSGDDRIINRDDDAERIAKTNKQRQKKQVKKEYVVIVYCFCFYFCYSYFYQADIS